MTTIRIEDMFGRIVDELNTARYALSEAAAWARSDWSDARGLTRKEAAARTAVFAAVQQAKDAIDRAKNRIYWAEPEEGHRHG
jgi:hypothetical protein